MMDYKKYLQLLGWLILSLLVSFIFITIVVESIDWELLQF
jgi:hypothetical protein